MKHIFIINPAAGKENAYETICSALDALETPVDYEIYLTQAPGDATTYIRSYCAEHPERVRFYACGGDGTLNEVVNGAVDFPQASIAVYPSGSGNDFVKYYGGKKHFLNIPALVEAEEEWIDLMRVDGKYAINATHFGFDSAVAQTMTNVRRKKLIGGKNAYTTGIVVSLFTAMKNDCRITVDGELLDPKGKILLCTIANGQYVGGAFRCAPRSLDNDGWLEVCMVRPVSHFTFLNLIREYTAGNHLECEKMQKYIEYRRGKRIRVEGPSDFVYAFDGELIPSNDFLVEVVPEAIRFAVPKSAKPLMGDAHVPHREGVEVAE